eukprot:CAMPEP_0181459126 /NCGR_PEP_ID=MMETSP1110-20121109/32666_1 /TAXON_ID=174948 /ORGANISM="Symbiodinium sp., Strain CCMP421" /LENGTH=48 /DNA_ID= /DNA_START= /DNA_END= /DNA_ORIENTATION=
MSILAARHLPAFTSPQQLRANGSPGEVWCFPELLLAMSKSTQASVATT